MYVNQGRDYFFLDRVSNSIVNSLDPTMGGSPQKMFAELTMQSDSKRTKSKDLGDVIHAIILQNLPYKFVNFSGSDTIREIVNETLLKTRALYPHHPFPLEKFEDIIYQTCQEKEFGKAWKRETTITKVIEAGSQYFEALRDIPEDSVLLTPEEYSIMDNIMSSISKYGYDSLIAEIRESTVEQEIEFEYRGVLCKAKPDSQLTDTLLDLKSSSGNIDSFHKEIIWRRIYRQLAFYSIPNPFTYHKVFAVETVFPYRPRLFTVPRALIAHGLQEINLLIDRYLFHIENGFEKSMEEFKCKDFNLIVTEEDGKKLANNMSVLSAPFNYTQESQ